MKLIPVLLFCCCRILSQAQNFQSLDTIQPPATYENIFSIPLFSDTLVSSFVIFVKKEVKAHKHISHSEHVYILDGEGEMMLDDSAKSPTGNKFNVKKGDMIIIPKGTVHSLTVISTIPVKVLSIQAPFFDGKDRVFVE